MRLSVVFCLAILPAVHIPGLSRAQGIQKTKEGANKAVQFRFARPSGMKVWVKDGKKPFANPALEVPGLLKLAQGVTHQLKLSNIEGRPGLERYPTLEVHKENDKTATFLKNTALVIEFTSEDFKRVADGELVTRVFILPKDEFREIMSDPELIGETTPYSITSYRLPRADVIREAARRGSILAVLRMGNVDLEK